MPFVKLDCGLLNSTIWGDKTLLQVFLTALLMAVPKELDNAAPTYAVRDGSKKKFTVPPGWYGFVPAAGVGIVRASGVDQEEGLSALEKLGEPESDSRTPDFDGRRLVRIDGGFIILNFMKYRDWDYTNKERQRRWRERQLKGKVRTKKK